MSTVSIVIRTYNSERTIEDCIESLLATTYSDYEILVVDDGSVDRTLELVQKYPVRVFRSSHGENPCNRGIRESSGRIIAFIDSDCVVPRNWLMGIVAILQDGQVGAAGGQETAPSDSNYWPRCFEALRKLEKRLLFHWGSVEQISNCNAAYRKEALVEVGGFSDYLFYGEETELNWRLSKSGWKILFDPTVVVLHNRRPSLLSYFRQQFATEFGMAQVIRMHSDFIKPSHLMMPGLLAIFVAILALFLSGAVVLGLYSAGAVVVIAVITSFHAAFVAQESKLVPGILIASIVFVISRSLGFMAGLATPLTRRTFPGRPRKKNVRRAYSPHRLEAVRGLFRGFIDRFNASRLCRSWTVRVISLASHCVSARDDRYSGNHFQC